MNLQHRLKRIEQRLSPPEQPVDEWTRLLSNHATLEELQRLEAIMERVVAAGEPVSWTTEETQYIAELQSTLHEREANTHNAPEPSTPQTGDRIA